MNTKTLSPEALSVIDSYIHFKIGSAVCAVPYFNNKTIRLRGAFRSRTGKGSPKDILEEAEVILVKNHMSAETLADESLGKVLADNGIGIDCSGFAYYVLDAESNSSANTSLKKKLYFSNNKGLTGKIRGYLRPVENCNVATLADDKNSKEINLGDARPGDMITMIGGVDYAERDHILVIHRVDYEDSIPKTIYYSHAIAYPEDGPYGKVRQGEISITDTKKPITEQAWKNDNIRILQRARGSRTSLKRLNWL